MHLPTTTSRRRSGRRAAAFAAAATGLALLAAGCSDADAGGSASGSGSKPAATRAITHAMGTTMVPAEPKRVVVLDTQELDVTLSLGVVPVGAVRTVVDSGLPAFLEGQPGDRDGRHDRGAQPRGDRRGAAGPDPVEQGPPREIDAKLDTIAPTVFARRPAMPGRRTSCCSATRSARRPRPSSGSPTTRPGPRRSREDRRGDKTLASSGSCLARSGSTALTRSAATILADVGFKRPRSSTRPRRSRSTRAGADRQG